MSDTTEDRSFKGWVRPLSLLSLRISPYEHLTEHVDPGQLLQDFCNDWTSQAVERIRARFLRVDTPELDIFVVPAENMVLDKLVWPLRHAKIAFCRSDFLGCIAICGMVCEMATVFVYELVAEASDLSRLESEDREILSEGTYETLRQQERIKGLLRMRVIPQNLAENLDKVRKIRREYLHFLKKDYSAIEDDACQAYEATCLTVKTLVGIPLDDKGKFRIPSHLERYMRSKEVIEPSSP